MKPDKGFSICLVQLLHATHGRPAVFSTLFFSLCRGYFCIVEVKRNRSQVSLEFGAVGNLLVVLNLIHTLLEKL